MKKLMTICIVLTAVAFLAAPAFAEVQNVKVSGDIKTMGIHRDDFDLTKTDGGSNDDQCAWYQSIVRLQVDADLTDNVSTTVRLLNERDWDTDTSSSNVDDDNNVTSVDLDIASITLKEAFYAPLTVIIGRQEVRPGTGMIIGDSDRNAASREDDITAVNYSARKAFDAIRGILDYDPLTIDILIAKVNETSATRVHAEDIDVYSVDATYVLENDATIGGYVVAMKDSAAATANTQDIWTLGARGAMAINDALDISGEVAVQTGDYSDTMDQDALAIDLGATYALNSTWEPVLGVGYIYRSGSNAGTTVGDYEAWLPLYEDQTHGLIADFLFDGVTGGVNSNCRIINLSADLQPMEDLSASIDYYKFALDKELAAGTHPGSNSSATMVANDDLGEELDVVLTYDYTEDVQLGFSAAWFSPGDALSGDNKDTAQELVGSIAVAF